MKVTQQEIVEAFRNYGELYQSPGMLRTADRIEANGIAPPDGYLLVRDDIMALTVECKCGVRQAKPVHHYLKQADEETHRRVDEAVRDGRIEDRRAGLEVQE